MEEEEKKEEGKKKEEDQGPNGCIKCLEGTWAVIYGIYSGIKFVVMAICNGIAYCWYPTKERCVACCENCNRRLNPQEDEAFSAFE